VEDVSRTEFSSEPPVTPLSLNTLLNSGRCGLFTRRWELVGRLADEHTMESDPPLFARISPQYRQKCALPSPRTQTLVPAHIQRTHSLHPLSSTAHADLQPPLHTRFLGLAPHSTLRS
jgi:hypothetical protein